MDRELSKSVRIKRRNRKIVTATLAAVVVLSIIKLMPTLLQPSITSENIYTGSADIGNIEVSINAAGKLVPLTEEIITSPITSRILEVYKKPGDPVAEGEPLVRLDISSVENDYHRMLDERQVMENKITQVNLRLRNSLSDLEMQREVRKMQADQYYADYLAERFLDSIGAGTQEKVRKTELQYLENKLQLEHIELKLQNERANSIAEIRQYELEFSILEKNLQEKARLVHDARILSPKTATLSVITDQIGQQISAGTQIAVISDLSRFKVESEISDNHRNKLSPGTRALVKAGDITLEGTVTHVSPSVANGILTFTVIPEATDHPELRSGLQADVHINYGYRNEVVRLPRGTYYRYGKGEYSLWVIREGYAEKRLVTLGEANHEYVEVEKGLAPGETVILNDMENYGSKQRIKIKK